MAINTPSVSTSISTPEINNPYIQNTLKSILMGQQAAADRTGQVLGGSIQGDILAQKGQQDLASDEASQKLRALLMGQEQDAAIQKAMGLHAQDPKMGVSLQGSGVSLSPHDTSMQQANQQARQDDRHERTIGKVTNDINKDYTGLVGKSPARVQAAQAIIEALKSNDISSTGRIKAQLPLLEGENYKPSDAEREIILQATGEGNLAKLKNFFGMSSPALSQSQKDALGKYVQNRLTDEQGLIDRSRAEVLQRRQPNLRSMTDQDVKDISASLGMSANELIKHLQSGAAPQPQQNMAAPQMQAPMAPQGMPQGAPMQQQGPGLTPQEQAELDMLRAKHGRR